MAIEKTGRPKGIKLRVEDVARLAGVSAITVSRTLSSPGRVAASTRARVMEAVAATGYAVNPLASSLKSGRSWMVLALIDATLAPGRMAQIAELAAALATTNFHIVLCHLPEDLLNRRVRLNAMLALRPAAALVFDTGVIPDLPAALRVVGIPLLAPEPDANASDLCAQLLGILLAPTGVPKPEASTA